MAKILGKPHSEEAAIAMLRALSGRSHRVLTGVTVMSPKGTETHCEETEVYFRPISDEEIRWYVKTGEPMDKAGSLRHSGLCGHVHREDQRRLLQCNGPSGLQEGLMLRRAGIPVLEAKE